MNALSAARSLSARGVDVDVVASPIGIVISRSRAVRQVVCPAQRADVQDAVLQWLPDGPRGAVVIPCDDDGLELVARHRSRLLELDYRPVEADDDVLLALLDKQRTYELAAAAGVAVPRTAVVVDETELEEAASKFDYPCALKPTKSHLYSRAFPGKAIVAGSPDQLLDGFRALQAADVAAVVSEIVPGRDEYCSYYSYLDEDGSPLLHFTKRKLRQYPIGFGTGTYHVSEWDPEVAEVGLRFFEAVGLRGLGNVEFKRDQRDGRLKLIECNARLTAADALVRRAGFDLPVLLYERALGTSRWTAPERQKDGVRQWHPSEDVRAFAGYRQAEALSTARWLRTLAHRQHLPLFDIRDPLPSAANSVVFAGRLVRLARRGRRR